MISRVWPGCLLAVMLFAGFAGCAPARRELAPAPAALSCPEPLVPYLRTSLYTADFGGEAWQRAVREVLLQHFPAGGAVFVSTDGWWRRPDGSTARGGGKTLVILVPATQAQAHHVAVRAVIAEIKQRFNQLSVGWEEDRLCAGF